jgi:hypothetical protein
VVMLQRIGRPESSPRFLCSLGSSVIRLTLILALCALLRAQSGTEAFLTKGTAWHAHPDAPNLRIGPGTAVILSEEGGAVRYIGEVWEYRESSGLVYELETHGGFVANRGGWRRSDGNRFVVEFKDTITSMVLSAPPARPGNVQMAKSCHFSTLLSETRVLLCGSNKLTRIRLRSVPQSLLPALRVRQEISEKSFRVR